MNIVTKINEWQHLRKSLSKTIGFVPTMGNLHEGHLSLCQQSLNDNEITVVSIFVNPTQFNQAKDFETYPRTIEDDIKLLTEKNVDYLFLPNTEDLYPDHYQVQVSETELSEVLEGEHRKGHFQGMLTIVIKLLNLIQPTKAYLGEKDFQQLLLVKKMVNALFIPTEIIGCETIRAADGLALSSRNTRLTANQRQKAAAFPKLLHSHQNTDEIIKALLTQGFKVDYVDDRWGRRLGAVWLDEVRLIDNIAKE